MHCKFIFVLHCRNASARTNVADSYDGLAVSRGELSAEQIVSRFADNAGLSLADVVSNYTDYANAIQQSFSSQRR